MSDQERPNQLIWGPNIRGPGEYMEWHQDCDGKGNGCAYHPEDLNDTHGGGPHVHHCAAHPDLVKVENDRLKIRAQELESVVAAYIDWDKATKQWILDGEPAHRRPHLVAMSEQLTHQVERVTAPALKGAS